VATTKAAKAEDTAPEAAEQEAPEELEPVPPFWIADVPLPVGAEMGGAAMPVRAFNPGDRVPADHVDRYGWRPYVSPPPGDWPPPVSPPESGTAGSDKE
jgi:hypothetical protein